MNRSLFLGTLAGIMLTLAVAFYLWDSGKLQRVDGAAPISTSAEGVTLIGATDNVEAGTPPTADAYEPPAKVSENANILEYYNKLRPNIRMAAWDNLLKAAGFNPMERSTTDCTFNAPEQAVTLPPHQANAVAERSVNVLFVDARAVKCFVVGSKISVLSDNLVGGDRLYNILGEALIQRVFQGELRNFPASLLVAIKVNVRDFVYLMNPDLSPARSTAAFTLLRIRFAKQSPLVDSTKIPPFVPGAVSLKPLAIKNYFDHFRLPGKPVFVDARDRKNISSGETYGEAVPAPFISSNPKQLKFNLAMPMSLAIGARFDLSRLPKDKETPLILFGNDETDAAPLWVLWHLRQNGYRTVFFVDGGLKALKQAGPKITF